MIQTIQFSPQNPDNWGLTVTLFDLYHHFQQTLRTTTTLRNVSGKQVTRSTYH